MERPTIVRILGRDYSIDYELDNGDLGSCDTNANEIEIMEGLPPVEERDTVLHEILHGVWALMGIDYPKIEETIVNRLATGLTQVFQDNPELMKYLSSKE